MDLRQLRYFVAVADEGSIRAAGRRLNAAPPQVSLAIRRLENDVGMRLVRRSTRGIELTSAGAELLRHGREILCAVEDAQRALAAPSRREPSTLRLGLVAGVLSAGELVAPILAAFRRSRPDVRLHVVDLGMLDQVTPIVERTVDVALVRLPLVHQDVVATPIAQEPRVVMIGLGHQLAQEDAVDLDVILSLPTLPMGCRPEWAAFWQLNSERGGCHVLRDIPPARDRRRGPIRSRDLPRNRHDTCDARAPRAEPAAPLGHAQRRLTERHRGRSPPA